MKPLASSFATTHFQVPSFLHALYAAPTSPDQLTRHHLVVPNMYPQPSHLEEGD